jgi:hypothetical protein
VSAIATFTRVREGAAALLGTAERTPEGFRKHATGDEICDYNSSGWVIGVLLAYLDEKHGVKFDNDIGMRVTKAEGTTTLVLTAGHKRDFLALMRPENFDETELEIYYNEFTETEEPGIGKAMLDGIDCFHRSLIAVDDGACVVVHVG